MRPSDSPTFVPPPLRSSLAGEVPRGSALVLCWSPSGHGRPCVRAANARRVGEWSPGLRGAGISRGKVGVSQVPGSSSLRAPSCHTPRDAPCPAHGGHDAMAFGVHRLLGISDQPFSRPNSDGSHACVPTHRAERYRSPRKARFRPVGVHPRRAGFPPAGRQTEFQEVIASFSPF